MPSYKPQLLLSSCKLRLLFAHLLLVTFFAFSFQEAEAQRTQPAIEENQRLLEELTIREKLGETIPADIRLVNEQGETVLLSELFESNKPVILNLIYFQCPSMCSLILNGVADAVEDLRWDLGREYQIITVSIDPDEDYQLAADVKHGYISRLNRSGNAEDNWHFLTGEQDQIDRLIEAVGMPFKWSEQAQEFLHGSAIMFVSPEMKITRYLYGVQYRELDVRNALFDAAGGRVGSTIERIALFCFTYDPDSRSYVPYAMNIMKVSGVVILLGLGIFLGIFWLKERKKSNSEFSFDD
ncbi:MAG: SCO family protein [Balneolales bacterium]|nr:SCO family protein [Balneolales bacterium]